MKKWVVFLGFIRLEQRDVWFWAGEDVAISDSVNEGQSFTREFAPLYTLQ